MTLLANDKMGRRRLWSFGEGKQNIDLDYGTVRQLALAREPHDHGANNTGGLQVGRIGSGVMRLQGEQRKPPHAGAEISRPSAPIHKPRPAWVENGVPGLLCIFRQKVGRHRLKEMGPRRSRG